MSDIQNPQGNLNSCPQCGYCPSCGRSNNSNRWPYYPYNPNPFYYQATNYFQGSIPVNIAGQTQGVN